MTSLKRPGRLKRVKLHILPRFQSFCFFGEAFILFVYFNFVQS